MRKISLLVGCCVMMAAVGCMTASVARVVARVEVPASSNASLDISEEKLQAMAAKLPSIELKKEVQLENALFPIPGGMLQSLMYREKEHLAGGEQTKLLDIYINVQMAMMVQGKEIVQIEYNPHVSVQQWHVDPATGIKVMFKWSFTGTGEKEVAVHFGVSIHDADGGNRYYSTEFVASEQAMSFLNEVKDKVAKKLAEEGAKLEEEEKKAPKVEI